MGREAKCFAQHAGDEGEGKALLETSEIIFRGPFRLVIAFKQIATLEVRKDVLHVAFGSDEASFHLGATEAAKWVKAIREPKTVLDKLGVKAGQKVAIIGTVQSEPPFADELKQRGALVESKPIAGLDHLFFAVDTLKDLGRVVALKKHLAPAGALWTLREKGRRDVSEAAVREACLAAGLVDVKVVAFSVTHTAEKFVIPVAKR